LPYNFFLEGIGGGFGHHGHPLATPLEGQPAEPTLVVNVPVYMRGLSVLRLSRQPTNASPSTGLNRSQRLHYSTVHRAADCPGGRYAAACTNI